jgi:diacylglycerol kinase (ATP)
MSKKDKPVRVKLIANPGAGKPSEAADKLKQAIRYLKQFHIKADVALAKPKEEATPIARRAAKDGYKTVIALGGDGTIEAVLRGLVGSKVKLGIVPAGTQNNIARSLGIPEDLEEACELIASGNTKKLDVGQIKTKKGKKFIFFELATIGLSAALYPDLNKVASGKLSNVVDATRTFLHQDTRPKVYLTLNDESKIKVRTMLVVISNTPIFGKNFMVAPGATMHDGLVDISVYPDFSKAELLRYYAAVMDGGYSGDKKVQQYQASKVKIKASPKLDILADGVALGKGKVKIKVHPKSLRVITNGESSSIFENQANNTGKNPSDPDAATVKNNGEEKPAINLG